MSTLPKWKNMIYTDFQRGMFIGSILWVFAIMLMVVMQKILTVWLLIVGAESWNIFGFIGLFAMLVFLSVRFLNWMFRKLYTSRYRIFPGD